MGVKSDIAGDSGDSNTPSATNNESGKAADSSAAADSTVAQSLSITGADAVAQFSTAQLTATTSPSNAEGTYIWSSNNDNILTVDQSGTVTGVRQGAVTVTLSYTSPDGNTTLTATHDVTVTSPTTATEYALFYYLNNPNGSLDSISTTQWVSLGGGSVNLTGLDSSNFPKDNGKTAIFDRVSDRVITWPDGSTGDEYQVLRGSSNWNNIFKAYKSEIEGKLPGVTVTDDDVESISIKPYKLTNNNDGYHVDCSVSITCRNLFNARYYVDDPTTPGEGFQLVASKLTYREGDTTDITDFPDVSLPLSKKVGGIEYTFNGWYTDQALTQQVEFPYTIDGNVNFYAKYLSGRQVIYDLAGGSWNNSDALVHAAQEGSTQTVKAEPTRVGYEFAGWTVSGLDDVTTLESGASFIMPDNNVTFTATWNKLLACNVKYLEQGTGKELSPADTLYGHAGDVVTANAKSDIEGYHLVDSTQASGKATLVEGETPEIVFYYEKDTANYRVNYFLNGTEQKVANSETRSAPWGSEVAASTKDIDGHTVVPGQTTTATVERDGSTVINIYYYQNVTLTANSATTKYTGELQHVEGYTCDVAEASFTGVTLLDGKGTDAGDYPYIFAPGTAGTVSTDGKYIVTKTNDGILVINPNSEKVVVKIKGNTGGGKYDGEEHGVEGYAVSYVVGGAASAGAPAGFDAGDISFAGTAKVTGTDAGSYPMGLDAGDFSYAGRNFSNVSFEVEDGQLTISKREVVVKPKDASRVFNGEALEASEWEVAEGSPDQFLAGQGISDPVFSGSQTAPGTSESSIVSWGYPENTKAGNYEIRTEKGTLNVTSRGAAETITVEANSTSATYDGGTHSAAGLKTTEFVVGGKAYTVSGLSTEDPSAADAGTYTNNVTGTAKVSDAAGNDVTSEFAVEIKDGSLVIGPAEVTIRPKDASKPYDGTPLVASEFTATGFAGGDGVEGVSYGGSQTDAGESGSTIAAYEAAGSTKLANYKITLGEGRLEVTANAEKVVVTIRENSATFPYDGEAKTAEGYEVAGISSALYKEGDFAFVGDAAHKVATGTDAGDYDMGLLPGDFENRSANFSNVVFAIEDGQLTILPATLTVTTHGASKPYDGTALTASGEISGFVNGETASFATTGSQTLVGTSANSYAITWDGTAKESNYNVVEGAIGTLEVTPSQVAINVTPHGGSKVYDGKPLTSAGIDVDGLPAGFTLDAATKGSITDVGELLAEIDAPTIVIRNAAGEDVTAQFANVTCGKAPLIVTKRPVTVTSATDSKVYDGVALTKHKAMVTAGSLVEGESFGYDFTGAQTAVGTSDNTFTVKAGANTSLDNYEITQVNGTLTVIAYTPPVPGPGTDEPTPGPGKNPSTPNGPTNSSDVTPSGSTTSDDMDSVPTASDSKETTMPKSADKATSGNNAQSEGKQSPDNASGAEQPTSCWVHWLMILGTIATLVYGAVVSLRRRRMTADLDKEIDAVLSGAKEGSGK